MNGEDLGAAGVTVADSFKPDGEDDDEDFGRSYGRLYRVDGYDFAGGGNSIAQEGFGEDRSEDFEGSYRGI